jgi:hypothetical protein
MLITRLAFLCFHMCVLCATLLCTADLCNNVLCSGPGARCDDISKQCMCPSGIADPTPGTVLSADGIACHGITRYNDNNAVTPR